MRKYILPVIVVVFAVLMIGSLYIIVKSLPELRGIFQPRQTAINVTLPKGKCLTSLAVFNFRPHGDNSDSKYYAAGFARAFADRIYCAPKHVTQQLSFNEINSAIDQSGKDHTKPVSDDFAAKLGKKLGLSYVITGDLTISGSNADISLCVIDTANPGTKQIHKISGNPADLPEMQSKLVKMAISDMKIKPDPVYAKELLQPNFTKPQVIKLYGRSILSTFKECETLRWQAVNEDPQASFPVIRLLEYYYYGPSSCAELRNSKKLAQITTKSSAVFADNSQMEILRGLLLAKQCKYQEAESYLKNAVNNDPGIYRSHTALAYVANLRKNDQLAISESKKAVGLWPNNPYLHALLAESYNTAASNARHGHIHSEMTRDNEIKWSKYTWLSMQEASISVKLDPDCENGWFQVLDNSQQLGRDADMRRAYSELIRINPRNMQAYTSYAFCFSPQWGGSNAEQEKIFAQAEKAFPRGSYCPLIVRAQSLAYNYDRNGGGSVGGRYANEVLQLADEVSQKAGNDCEDAMLLKCRAYVLNRRRADLLQLAESGFNKWGGLRWQYYYGMGLQFAYEDTCNSAYLKKAKVVFADYSKEVPFDPRGYIQTGWCLSHLGKTADAKAQFLKALKLDPTNESARKKLQYVQ
ncbi:MAG: tetratricopeptide repeat protein [Armatimonadota bacterium]